MAIVENAELKLTLTVYADEIEDIAALVRDAAKEIKRGSLAGNVGGCLGFYQYEVEEQGRAAQHRVQRTLLVCTCEKFEPANEVSKLCRHCGLPQSQ